MICESKRQPVASRRHFLRRMGNRGLMVAALLAVSPGIGMTGYMALERLFWSDAFLNSAMLLGGMGPVNPPLTLAGKLFAGWYALDAGLVFIVTAALLWIA